MEGGSLEDRLLLGTVFDEPNGAQHAAARLSRLAQLGFNAPPPPLTWAERLRALVDVMEALVYLHTPSEAKAVELHRGSSKRKAEPSARLTHLASAQALRNSSCLTNRHCDVKPSNMLLARRPEHADPRLEQP